MNTETEHVPTPRQHKARTKSKIHWRIATKYKVDKIIGLKMACSTCDHGAGLHKCCPSCKISANGAAEIDVIFGFRKPSVDSEFAIPQARCRDCR